MSIISINPTQARRFDPRALDGMYRLRHRVFHERLGWEVSSRQGMEMDEYDALNPVYLVARGPRHEIRGCVRLLPTSGPYMLRDTFPALLAGETAPNSERIWDISRLAVARPETESGGVAGINDTTVDIVLAVLDYALDHGVDRYVAVISVALERILRRIGLRLTRFGDRRARRMGKALSVAVWIDVDAATREAIAQRHQPTQPEAGRAA